MGPPVGIPGLPLDLTQLTLSAGHPSLVAGKKRPLEDEEVFHLV